MRASRRKQKPGYQGGMKPTHKVVWEEYTTKSRAGVEYKKSRQVTVAI